jgi:hypothetical protein
MACLLRLGALGDLIPLGSRLQALPCSDQVWSTVRSSTGCVNRPRRARVTGTLKCVKEGLRALTFHDLRALAGTTLIAADAYMCT